MLLPPEQVHEFANTDSVIALMQYFGNVWTLRALLLISCTNVHEYAYENDAGY